MIDLIGVALVLFYIFMSAVSGVFLSIFLVKLDVFTTICYVFSLISFLFNAYIIWTHGLICKRFSREIWFYVLLLNLTTSGNWLGFFFAVRYIEPAISATLINSVLPLVTIGIATLVLSQRTKGPTEILSALALMVAMLLTGGLVFSGQSSRPTIELSDSVIGIGMSLVCGVSIALNTVVAKKLNTLGMTPSAIMAYRFFLLILVAATFADSSELLVNAKQYYWELLFIAVVCNLVPLFSLQLAIKRLNPVTVVFLNGLAPLIYFVVQFISGFYAFSLASFISTLFTTSVICLGAYYSNRSTLASPSSKARLMDVPAVLVGGGGKENSA